MKYRKKICREICQIITLNGIEKKLGTFSLSINELKIPGPNIYGLIGPNGSGKSVLAKLISGLIEPDKGSIDTGRLKESDITFLSRKPYMMNDTVYNNLVYPLRVRNIKPDLNLINEYLSFMGFTEKSKQKAKSLSGGEQQKLAFLRALIFKPKLIIADEAMTALDIDSLDHFENLTLESQKRDPAIWIIISHQMPHLRRLTSHIFFMYQGKVETEGSTDEIFLSPVNQHLKQYLRAYGSGETGETK
jgi:ABC-type multidrug transport system ATPase subunit